jgi:hypothetical protein
MPVLRQGCPGPAERRLGECQITIYICSLAHVRLNRCHPTMQFSGGLLIGASGRQIVLPTEETSVQISLICTLRTVAATRLDLRQIGGYLRLHHGPQSRQVIALAAAWQLGMAAGTTRIANIATAMV